MSLLPGWWVALIEAGAEGLTTGSGPFWTGRFLCGLPLFGTVEGALSGPAATLAMLAPGLWLLLHATVFVAGLSLWLRRSPLGLGAMAAGSLAGLVVAGALLHPESAVLLGAWAWLPWTVLLVGQVPAWASAPFVALLLCGASPLLAALALGFSLFGAVRREVWAAWGLGAAMAAPMLLEMLRQMPTSASVLAPAWPLGWLGSPLLFFQACLLLLFVFAVVNGWARARAGIFVGLLAGASALGTAWLAPRPQAGVVAAPAAYLKFESRRHLALGSMPTAAGALMAERWTGAAGGMAPRRSLRRWAALGAEREDDLSLANVGWVGGDGGAEGRRWFKPVAGAVVNQAAALGGGPADAPLFSRPLRVELKSLGASQGGSWKLSSPKAMGPAAYGQDLGAPEQGAWAFLSESFDRGWRAIATDDLGAESSLTVREAENGFLAAPLRPQDRRITWRYAPPAWPIGLFLAIIGFMAAGFVRRKSLVH